MNCPIDNKKTICNNQNRDDSQNMTTQNNSVISSQECVEFQPKIAANDLTIKGQTLDTESEQDPRYL